MIRPYNVAADAPLIAGPVLYYGGFLRAGAGGAAAVVVYDGNSAQWPVLDAFAAAADAIDRGPKPVPIFALRGIFVDIGANVDTFILYLDDDIPEDSSVPSNRP